MKHPGPWKSTAKTRKASKRAERKNPIVTKQALARAKREMEANARRLNGNSGA